MVQMVGGAAGLGVVLFAQCQGPEAAGLKQAGAATLAIGFRQPARAIVLKAGFALRGVFGDAPAQGVVAVLRRAIRRFGADQTVLAIVLIAGDDVIGLAAVFWVITQMRTKRSESGFDYELTPYYHIRFR